MKIDLRSNLTRYLLGVIVPVVLLTLYLSVFATEGYISRATFVIEKDASMAASGAELALGLLSVSGGRSKQDVLLVSEYMQSRTMLYALEQSLGLKQHFTSSDVDIIARLPDDASSEDFLDFYQNHLTISIDDDSLILNLEFTAFSSEFAYKVSSALVGFSEQFVNDVSRRLALEQVVFMEGQVKDAHRRLQVAMRDLIDLQKKSEIFSPEKESQAVGEILVGLEVELSKQRTQLKLLESYLTSSAPDVIAVTKQVRALEAQLAQERKRLIGDEKQGSGLNDMALIYQDAEVAVKLAVEIYQSTLTSLESTRFESLKKVKHLVAVDAPSLPDSTELPRVLYWVVTAFIVLNLLYFVLGLLVATIQDHRE